MRGSGDDLENCFYLLSHKPVWRPRNCFGRVFSGSDATALRGDAAQRYHMMLKVVAMGELNSVDVAQATHVGLLKKAGCMSNKDALRYGNPLPRGHVLKGVYVDDHLVVGIVPKHLCHVRIGPDVDLIDAPRAAYKAAKAPVSSSKTFDCKTDFVAWGTEVKSEVGIVGAPAKRRLQILVLTLFVLVCPGVGQKLMKSLLGSFVHSFSHCKYLMSIFSRAFKWVHSLKKKVMVRIPPDVREELLIAALHLPLACTNIRAPVSSHVTCSDATLTIAGVVESRVSRDLSLALYHHSAHKGAYTRLDWNQTDWCLQPWIKNQTARCFVCRRTSCRLEMLCAMRSLHRQSCKYPGGTCHTVCS